MHTAAPERSTTESVPRAAPGRRISLDWERLVPRLILGFAVAFNLATLYPEAAIRVRYVNDGVLHLLALTHAIAAMAGGHDPTDSWLPGVALGFAWFHHYQHLPYVAPAAILFALNRLVGGALQVADGFAWTGYLLLAAFPLSMYWSMRRLGFERLPAALAGLVASLLATDGLYGLDLGSYVWRGFGLYTQIWGMVLLPPALAHGYMTLREGRGYFPAAALIAATTLSHLAYGFIALATLPVLAALLLPRLGVGRVAGRLALLLLPTVLATAYFLLPLALDGAYLNRSIWEAAFKYDSFGHEWILGNLVRGNLFDFGRLPVLTVLAAVGLGVCIRNWRDERYRFPVALAILWLLAYFGRATWGALLDLLPGSRDLPFHRLIGGIHLGGIMLMGIGLALPLAWALARRDARITVAAFAVAALALLPVYRERVAYLDFNAELMRTSQRAYAAEQRDLTALFQTLRALPPGRVYAGLAGYWGKEYRIGEVKMYGLLTDAGFDVLGFLYHALSLNAEVITLFDEQRPEQYELFNVRYVVAPRDRAFPDFVKPIGEFGRHRLYQVDTSGYFALVGSDTTFVGNKTQFYPAASRWQNTDEPRVKQHPTLVLKGDAPGGQQAFPLAQADVLLPGGRLPDGPARGEVLAETVEMDRYSSRVAVERDSMLMLKVTYHPNWHAFVDGVETKTAMLMPSYLGVPIGPGMHEVRLEYRPQPWRAALMVLGLLALALTAAAERQRVALARVVGSIPHPRLRLFPIPGRLSSSALGQPSLLWRAWASGRIRAGAARSELAPHLPYLGGVVVLTLLAGLPLLQLKLMSGHDYLEYLPRNVEFFRALTQGQLVPRWAPDFSGGYGEPFFSFNPPLIYAMTAALHALGFNFVAAENLACLALLLLAGLAMYLLAGAFVGPRGGLVAATAYVFAPYVLVTLYVRHALADYAAFPFIPLAYWGIWRFAEAGRYRYFAVGALAVALLFLSSNPVSLIAVPTIALLVGWLAWSMRSGNVALRGAWCLGVGTGLAAYFWLPALAEREFVHVHRLLEGGLNYRNHFVELRQLVDSPWGYGVSLPGPGDGMSFAIGTAYLVMAVAALALLRWTWAASPRAGRMVAFALVVGAVGAFFSVGESIFIWDRLPLLQYLEYPWRFHSLIAVGTAFLFGLPLLFIRSQRTWLANGATAALMGLVLVMNYAHAKPEKLTDVTDADYTPRAIASKWLGATTALEYEPIWVRERPQAPVTQPAQLAGRGSVTAIRRTPTETELRVEADEEALLRVNTFYFPGWTAFVDGRERTIDWTNPQGVMELPLERGSHLVRLWFGDTPIRVWARWLSFLALVLLASPLLVMRSGGLPGRGLATRWAWLRASPWPHVRPEPPPAVSILADPSEDRALSPNPFSSARATGGELAQTGTPLPADSLPALEGTGVPLARSKMQSALVTGLRPESQSELRTDEGRLQTPMSRPAAPGARARTMIGIYLLFLSVYLVFTPGHFRTTDEVAVYLTTQSLEERQSLAIKPINDAVIRPDGTAYSVYGVGQAVLSLPLYLAGRLVEQVSPPPVRKLFAGPNLGDWGGSVPIFFVSLLNQFVMPLVCLLVFAFCLRLGFSQWTALLTTLIFGFGTSAWVFAHDYFQHALESLALLSCIYVLFSNIDCLRPRHALAAGMLLAGGILTRVNLLFAAPLIGLYLLSLAIGRVGGGITEPPVNTGSGAFRIHAAWASVWAVRSYAIAFTAPILIVFILTLVLNAARYGSALAFSPAAAQQGFTLNVLPGVYGYLLSLGRSIFLYSPALILGVAMIPKLFRERRREAVLIVSLAAIYLLFYSSFRLWHGEWSWGPRYLFLVVPLLTIPIGYGLANRVTLFAALALTMLGAGVQFLGIVVNYSFVYYDWMAMGLLPERAFLFVPEISPPAMHLTSLVAGRHVDFWLAWVYHEFGVGAACAALAIPCALLACSIWLLCGPIVPALSRTRMHARRARR
jgi:hypothetical protein